MFQKKKTLNYDKKGRNNCPILKIIGNLAIIFKNLIL